MLVLEVVFLEFLDSLVFNEILYFLLNQDWVEKGNGLPFLLIALVFHYF